MTGNTTSYTYRGILLVRSGEGVCHIMVRMVRKQILIEADLDAELERASAEQGVSQGEFVRRALRDAIDGDSARRHEAFERLMAGAETWRAGTATAGESVSAGRSWTREQLYERDRDAGADDFDAGSRGHERAGLPVGREVPGEDEDRDEVDV
jgi:hypothetical protein